jgi:hypothetical protein
MPASLAGFECGLRVDALVPHVAVFVAMPEIERLEVTRILEFV